MIVAGHGVSVAGESKAGAYAQDITPTRLPAPISGSWLTPRVSVVTDPMHARCLAMSNGEREVIFCVVDALAISREVCEATKAIVSRDTGVPPAHLLISATHSHSTAAMTTTGQTEADPAYLAELPGRIAEGMIRAHRNLEPAEIGWGEGYEPTQVFNRRWLMKPGEAYVNPFGRSDDRVQTNPGFQSPKVSQTAGPVDPGVGVLAARALRDQRPIAILANYSLHYVGGKAPISADYFGAFAGEIARRVGAGDTRYSGKPAFVGIMSNGASGDINNVDLRSTPGPRKKPGEQIEIVARALSDVVLAAYAKLTWTAAPEIRSVERDLLLRVRKPSPEQQRRAREQLQGAARDKHGQLTGREAIYAYEALQLAAYPDLVPVKLQLHRIGGLTVAGIPCEVFAHTGLELKARRPLAAHFTIELANGYNGYLPTPIDHSLGGYETWPASTSYLEVDASTKIVDALQQMGAPWSSPSQ